MATKKSGKKHQTKLKKVASKKANHNPKPRQKSPSEESDRATQARIEIEFKGPTEELGKLLFDLFQAHELKAGDTKEIAPDVKIELLPAQVAKGLPSVAVMLTIGSGVPENLASNYLWRKCDTFSKSRDVKILVNRTEHVYNERELRKIIKTTLEKETRAR